MDIHFDVTSSESQNVISARQVVDLLRNRGLSKLSSDGLSIVQSGSIDGYATVGKSDNTSVYLSREIASLLQREKEYGADEYVYVVDISQAHHFKNLKAVLSLMGLHDLGEKVTHVSFGRVRGLSTRSGRTQAVDEIIESGSEVAEKFLMSSPTIRIHHDELKNVARALSIDTITVSDLKRSRNAEYIFSFKDAFKLNQGNALLLQMKHSRLCSLEERNAELLDKMDDEQYDDLELNDVTVSLLRHLANFDDVLNSSIRKMEPCVVTVYLIQLANLIGTAMAALQVQGEPIEKAVPRLLLFSASKNVLSAGMKLLGIRPLKQM
ncbi:hypothetical protein AB6A40_006406 [Gnathostoma spinigerum]|uniref:Probable arginine--tRNA ligase, mitochondrial n=1 Tax=Gnathostoma spinigerum TaxID=75299 RepID=A0ABD6ESN8_9BILA